MNKPRCCLMYHDEIVEISIEFDDSEPLIRIASLSGRPIDEWFRYLFKRDASVNEGVLVKVRENFIDNPSDWVDHDLNSLEYSLTRDKNISSGGIEFLLNSEVLKRLSRLSLTALKDYKISLERYREISQGDVLNKVEIKNAGLVCRNFANEFAKLLSPETHSD